MQIFCFSKIEVCVFYLCSEIVLRLEAENLDGRNVQVDEDVFEGGPVAGLGCPALLDQKLVAFRASSRNW